MSDLSRSPMFLAYRGPVGITTFPVETEITGWEARPIYDSAGRTVKYSQITLTVRSVFGHANQVLGQTTDSTFATLRKNLTGPGGELQAHSHGHGDLAVNVPAGGPMAGGIASTVKDVVWGPKPAVLRWKGHGDRAMEVDWQVVVCFQEGDAPAYQFAPLEQVFEVSYEPDRSGYVKRVISGHLIIAQTRASVNDRSLADNADAYLARVVPPLLSGFRRTWGPRKLSEDKCRLDWSCVDQQEGPSYPPPGVVEAKLSHSVATQMPMGGMWTSTLRADYELHLGEPVRTAYDHFLDVLEDRRKQALAVRFRAPAGGKDKGNFPLLRAMSFTEPEGYGKTKLSATATWIYFASIQDALVAGGLWRPLPKSDWQNWAASLQDGAFHARGISKLAFKNDEDAIIDLCLPNQRERPLRGGLPPPGPPRGLTGRPFRNPVPPPEISFLEYQCAFALEPIDETVELKPLLTHPVRSQGGSPGRGGGSPGLDHPVIRASPGLAPDVGLRGGGLVAPGLSLGMPTASARALTSAPGHEPPVVQQRAQSTYIAWIYGYGIRAGFPINVPALIAVGGRPVAPANIGGCGFAHGLFDSWFGLNIYWCRWMLRYIVLGKPEAEVPVISHPHFGH